MTPETKTANRTKWAIVDDEAMVLEVLAAFLAGITDAELELFENPSEAYDAILANPNSFEMIVTDRTMPQLDGIGLLVLVREVAPHIRMVILTGNRTRLEHELKRFNLPVYFMIKPFTVEQLAEAVKNAPVISERSEILDERLNK